MKKLRVYLKEYKTECMLAPAFKMLEAVFELLVPLVVADIINYGIHLHDRAYIFSRVLLLLVLGLIGMIASITAQYFAARSAVGFATRIRQALFDHIQGLSYTELDSIGTNTLITRMTSDVMQVQNGLNMTLRLLLRSPFIVFGSMIMAFTISVKAALVFVVVIPILSLIVFLIMRVCIPLFQKVQQDLDRLLGMTRDNLVGIRVIRAFCKEKDSVHEFDETNDRFTRRNEQLGHISALINPLTYSTVNIATVALIYIGAWQVHFGILQQGHVVALYNYMAQIIVELIKLANLIVTINKAVACSGRIESILAVDTTMSYPETKIMQQRQNGSVCFQNVTFTYAKAKAASLTDLNFNVEKGQTVGIIGGTGSGKSSLVNLICRFYDVSRGRVLVDGVDVKDYPKHMLGDKIGVVPQQVVLFEGSIRDNLKWGKQEASDEELWDALTLAQAKEIVEKKAGGLDHRLEQNGKNLSGGQRQRLTIARALLKRPEILILDDSSSALDYATDVALRKAIHSLKDMTVFIVSQRISGIRNADLILVLDDGSIVGQGTHDTLLEHCEVYRDIYASQYPKEAIA